MDIKLARLLGMKYFCDIVAVVGLKWHPFPFAHTLSPSFPFPLAYQANSTELHPGIIGAECFVVKRNHVQSTKMSIT